MALITINNFNDRSIKILRENKLYPSGFIFTEESISKLPQYYKHISILDKYKFYYDSSMNPILYHYDNKFIIIYGHFVHAGFEKAIDDKELPKILLKTYSDDYDEFLSIIDFIGGRFVIIIGNENSTEVFQDATGARSTYYMMNKDVIASHIYLISDNFNCIEDYLSSVVPPLQNSFMSTKYENVRSLIPNFKLHIQSKEVKRFFPRNQNRYLRLTEKERVDMVEVLWKKQLSFYINEYDNILLSLTGGNDSRVSLALVNEFKDKLLFFTYSPSASSYNPENKSHRILDKDRIIVEKILQDVKLNHKFIHYDESLEENILDEDIINILNRNTTQEHSRILLAYYEKFFPQENLLHIRGNLLEIGRAYFITAKKTNNPIEVYNTFHFGIKKYINENIDSDVNIYINNQLDKMGYNDNLYDYHVLDLFYWENRTGRWHAEVLNETDYVFETMLPFNMRAIIELSLSFSLTKRKNNYLFKELINNNLPILNFYGENDINNLYEKTRDLDYFELNNIQKFNDFIVYDKEIDKNFSIETMNNQIYIPERHLKIDSYAVKEFIFNSNHGFVTLEIHSHYLSSNAKKYLEYEVLVNNEILLKEDMSEWNVPNNINIFNLKKNDVIAIKVKSLKNVSARSWESASKLKFNKFLETETSLSFENCIVCTSPYSLIMNDKNTV